MDTTRIDALKEIKAACERYTEVNRRVRSACEPSAEQPFARFPTAEEESAKEAAERELVAAVNALRFLPSMQSADGRGLPVGTRAWTHPRYGHVVLHKGGGNGDWAEYTSAAQLKEFARKGAIRRKAAWERENF